jgi:hypothetical protein
MGPPLAENGSPCTNAFLDKHNAQPKPFRYVKSASDTFAAIERFSIYNTSSR